MNVSIITTFRKAGYNEYAKFLVESLKKHLDPDITVFFYLDDMTIDDLPNNMKVIDFHKAVPELKEFRDRNKSKHYQSFLYDACRFSFKSYAWCHAGLTSNSDILIWLDADCELYNRVTSNYLIEKIPEGYFTSHLDRPDEYTETGFLAWNLNHPFSKEFFLRYKSYYDNDSIFTLPGFTDCHVYDDVTRKMVKEEKIKIYNLSPPGVSKNHLNIAFNGHIAHYKGDRVAKRDKILSKFRKLKK